MKTIKDIVDETPQILIFKDDDEFTDFCISPIARAYSNEYGNFYDYPFTDAYLDHINNGGQIKIVDPNSLVRKRGCACRGFITKKVCDIL